jgi:protein TonB
MASAAARSPDTTYYTIRQLDIYPVPMEPLRLTHLAPNLTGEGRLRAVVELHISETGVVDAAKVIEAHPAGYLEGQLATFLAARFTPAVRDGRAVRSRVVVRID